MSKNENKGEAQNQKSKSCDGNCISSCDTYYWDKSGVFTNLEQHKCLKRENEQNKSLLKYYEDEDAKNILTNHGRDMLYNAKRVAIYVFFALLALTALSIKKTLDNIETRLHNASSVTTK